VPVDRGGFQSPTSGQNAELTGGNRCKPVLVIIIVALCHAWAKCLRQLDKGLEHFQRLENIFLKKSEETFLPIYFNEMA
jgi:hypothetical protein